MPDPIALQAAQRPQSINVHPSAPLPNEVAAPLQPAGDSWTGAPREGLKAGNRPELAGLLAPPAFSASQLSLSSGKGASGFLAFFKAIFELIASLLAALFGRESRSEATDEAEQLEALGRRLARDAEPALLCLKIWTDRLGIEAELEERMLQTLVNGVRRARHEQGNPVSQEKAEQDARAILRGMTRELGQPSDDDVEGAVRALSGTMGEPWPALTERALTGTDSGQRREVADVLLYLMQARQNGLVDIPIGGLEPWLGALRTGFVSPTDVVRSISALGDLSASQKARLYASLREVPEYASVSLHTIVAEQSAEWAQSSRALDSVIGQLSRARGEIERLGSAARVTEAFENGSLGADPNAPLLASLRRDERGRVQANGTQDGILFVAMGDDSGFEAERLRRRAPEGVVYMGNPTNQILSSNLGVPGVLGGGRVRLRVKSEGRTRVREFDLNDDAGRREFVSVLGLSRPKARALCELLAQKRGWGDDGSADSRDEIAMIAVAMHEGETGARTLERMVISSHSGGSSYWGDTNGELQRKDLTALAQLFPAAAAQVEDLNISACYNGGPSNAQFFLDTFPNLKTLFAYAGSAPGSYTSATAHQQAWEAGTRGRFVDSAELVRQHTALQSDLAHDRREGTRFYKSDHIVIWAADRGFWPEAPEVAALRQGYTAAEQAYREHFEGRVPINSQTGPLREHYNTVQALLANREVIGDERAELESRRDTSIRLLFFDSHVRGRFMEEYGQTIRAGYEAAGVDLPDFANLSRADTLAAVAAFEEAARASTSEAVRRAAALLRDGLVDLSPAVIPLVWI